MFKCESHPRGHKSEAARDVCEARRRKREARAKAREADRERRLANQGREPERDFARRSYCRDGELPERVAATLNRDYPKREDRPWSWTDVIAIHAEHLKWPAPDDASWIPEGVLLPSELRKRAGVSMEQGMQ